MNSIFRSALSIVFGRWMSGHQLHSREFGGTVSGLIDERWYLENHKEVASSGLSAYQHFIMYGLAKGYDPSPWFWTNWYLEKNPDVAAAKIEPFRHFVLYGSNEGRDPSPLFDTKWYREHYVDVAKSNENPLFHFMTIGESQGRSTKRDTAFVDFCAFKASNETPPIRRILSAAFQAKNAGAEGLYQARLVAGRTVLSEKGYKIVNLARGNLGKRIMAEAAASKAFKLEPYLGLFIDTTIIPGSATLVPEEGTAINDEVLFTSSDQEPLKAWNKAWTNNGQILFQYRIDLAPKIKSGIHLFKEHEQNYFHFITELATKLHLIESDGLIPTNVPILLSDDLDKRIYELVTVIKHPDRKLLKLRRDVPHKVQQLYYLSDISKILDEYNKVPTETSTFISNSMLKSLSKSIRNHFHSHKTKQSHLLYLARAPGRRHIKNQDELIQSLYEIGFETVPLDLLNFATQVKLFSSAKFIIGPTGAGFTNLIWCSPHTKVLILYPEHQLSNKTFWNAIGDAMDLQIEFYDGCRSGDLQGRYAMHDSFTVDPERIVASVKRLN